MSTLTAFGLAVEVGDWERLSGRTIGAFLGLVPSEHSSGQSRSRGPITKTGNGHARRLLVEAAWHHRKPYRPSLVMNWRGRPLTSHQIIVDLIGATSTATGLTVRAELDTGTYPTGIRYTKAQVDALPISRHEFHGEWNYTFAPAQADTPKPT